MLHNVNCIYFLCCVTKASANTQQLQWLLGLLRYDEGGQELIADSASITTLSVFKRFHSAKKSIGKPTSVQTRTKNNKQKDGQIRKV